MKTLLNNLLFPMPLFDAPDEGAANPAAPADPPPSMLEGDELSSDDKPSDDKPAEEGDEKPADDKPTDDVPEALTFEALTLPEGVDITDETSVKFLELMNDAELSPTERAQGLLDLQQEGTAAIVEGLKTEMQTYWDTQRKDNQAAVRALDGFKGENLNKNLAQIKKGLEAVGATPETFKAFTTTGAGDHPEIVRVLFELTKAQQEGGPISGDPDRAKLSREDRMFPSST